jgi:hypothetical protein
MSFVPRDRTGLFVISITSIDKYIPTSGLNLKLISLFEVTEESIKSAQQAIYRITT